MVLKVLLWAITHLHMQNNEFSARDEQSIRGTHFKNKLEFNATTHPTDK